MKTKQSHTPGPWKIETNGNGKDIEVLNGRYVTRVYDHSTKESKFVKENNLLRKEAEANARLIAAAPELKFYLKDLIDQIHQFPQIRDGVNMSYALKAIAKAEGK